MNVEKKNFKDAANEDNYSVEIFIDKFTGELCYRNSLGQKVLINTKTLSPDKAAARDVFADADANALKK